MGVRWEKQLAEDSILPGHTACIDWRTGHPSPWNSARQALVGFCNGNSISIAGQAVYIHCLHSPECCAPGNEEAALIQLPDAIMLDRIAVAYCNMNWDRLVMNLVVNIYYIFKWFDTYLRASSHCGDSRNRVLKMRRVHSLAVTVFSQPQCVWFCGSTSCNKTTTTTRTTISKCKKEIVVNIIYI